MKKPTSYQVAIVGAGPYGLCAAAHLREAGIEHVVFGEAMDFWEKHMPVGMLLRSVRSASHIASPGGVYSLDRYCETRRLELPQPMTMKQFIAYGRWYAEQAAPSLDRRQVVQIERGPKGFLLRLGDEEQIAAQRVVVATGLAPFANRPDEFAELPEELVTHTSQHPCLRHFAGRRMAVVGGGQGALESAAILHEAGAEVEVITRQPKINWLDQKASWLKSKSNPLRALMYPPTDVGPPGLNMIVATPELFRRLPRRLQEAIAYRSIRPAGSGWLVPRLRTVPMTTGRSVRHAAAKGSEVELTLDDGSTRRVQHVLLATGYRVDVTKYDFLAERVLRELAVEDGSPTLRRGLESSIEGLHFLGAPAARSFGPLCRFVSGTTFAGAALTHRIRNSRLAPPQPPVPQVEELAIA